MRQSIFFKLHQGFGTKNYSLNKLYFKRSVFKFALSLLKSLHNFILNGLKRNFYFSMVK